MRKLFTSESVTEGHPDKLCDYISDSVLDAYLRQDSKARVACETVAGKGLVLVTGEITSSANVDIEKVVRDTIKEIGYTDENTDISYEKCQVIVNISKQSADIALGVDNSFESKNSENESKEDTAVNSEGAGDQGMVFGFATDETENYLPMPIYLSHKLAKRLSDVRKNGEIKYLRPDGKVQVTVEYEDNKPVRIDTVVVSTQHEENVDLNVLKSDIKEKVINKTIPENIYFVELEATFIDTNTLKNVGLLISTGCTSALLYPYVHIHKAAEGYNFQSLPVHLLLLSCGTHPHNGTTCYKPLPYHLLKAPW